MEVKTSKISTKGQLTIPKEFREILNLHKGDEVILYLQGGEIVIKPKTSDLGKLRGLLKEELDLEKAANFIEEERKRWRL